MVAHRQSRAIWPIFLGAALLFCVFFVFAWLVVRQTRETRGVYTFEQERAKARTERLEKYRTEQEAKLSETAWVEKEKGIARVPVDAAMTLVVQELQSKRHRATTTKPGAAPADPWAASEIAPEPIAPPAAHAPEEPAAPAPASLPASPSQE